MISNGKLQKIQILKFFRQSNILADVTLVCDDQRELKAHKVVLSSLSVVMENILTGHSEENLRIYLTGIQYKHMESILEFIYSGETSLEKKDIHETNEIAKQLAFKEFQLENTESMKYTIQEVGCEGPEACNSPEKSDKLSEKKIENKEGPVKDGLTFTVPKLDFPVGKREHISDVPILPNNSNKDKH